MAYGPSTIDDLLQAHRHVLAVIDGGDSAAVVACLLESAMYHDQYARGLRTAAGLRLAACRGAMESEEYAALLERAGLDRQTATVLLELAVTGRAARLVAL